MRVKDKKGAPELAQEAALCYHIPENMVVLPAFRGLDCRVQPHSHTMLHFPTILYNNSRLLANPS
jgi:hypothetical protein